jgi:Protein of unknown function (DUF2283)
LTISRKACSGNAFSVLVRTKPFSSPGLLQRGKDKPGVILDYDQHGDLLAIEILDTSRRVTDARKIE